MKSVRAFLLHQFERLASVPPVTQISLGYALYMLFGWALLSLPFAGAPNAPATDALDHLFTAVSAVSTTGLVTTSTQGTYTFFGEFVVLALIQVGGLGYMTLGSFVVLTRTGELSSSRRAVGEKAFTLPAGFDLTSFLRAVVVFSLVIEAIGAAILYIAFQRAGLDDVWWLAIFHSVSAFCTAGFGLFDTSLEAFRTDPVVNITIAALSYLGAIGFIVMLDLWRRLIGRTRRMTLTSRLILAVTLWFAIGATALIFLGDASIRALPPADRLMTSFFQAMTAMTTVGFNTFPVADLGRGTLIVLMVLMVIGASPSGTGGGLKTTTFTAMWGFARCQLLGRDRVTFWGREVPEARLRTAAAATGLYLGTLVVGVYLLELILPKDAAFEDILFEAVSALGTVGLSRGLTPDLTALGELVIIALMFTGRVGPVTLAMALTLRRARPSGNDLAI